MKSLEMQSVDIGYDVVKVVCDIVDLALEDARRRCSQNGNREGADALAFLKFELGRTCHEVINAAKAERDRKAKTEPAKAEPANFPNVPEASAPPRPMPPPPPPRPKPPERKP